ncbi:MAG: hypothetical protein LBU38_04105, partial [Propionibacteriaceae bacterium]|nr:hypothetical protein [Propionibacteriaceae bacterium]
MGDRKLPTSWGLPTCPGANGWIVRSFPHIGAGFPYPALVRRVAGHAISIVCVARIESLAGRLARMGFGDSERVLPIAETLAGAIAEADALMLIEDLAKTPDPDMAIRLLGRLVEDNPALLAELISSPDLRTRLLAVLGVSVALGQHLISHPSDLQVLRGDISARSDGELAQELRQAVGAISADAAVSDRSACDALRLAYYRALLRIAARDLGGSKPAGAVPEIAAELSDLADATVAAALILARGEVRGWENCRLAVLALGKAGAQELNYVSDVDVVFVAQPALDARGNPVCDNSEAVAIGTKLASAIMRITSAHTNAGTIWPIDANLRPEGKVGPLVRTLASYEAYYQKWAKGWEFQAMLKARPMAGDFELGQEFADMVWPLVWRVADDPNFVVETQAMRRRVVSLLPPAEADYEIKLGAGGLRDVEFTVQLLQLVHGRADERLRIRGTFPALEALVAHGYIGRKDGMELRKAY